jgi:hypothetical protein
VGSITGLALETSTEITGGAPLLAGCATSRAFREVACRAEDTFPVSLLELFAKTVSEQNALDSDVKIDS